MDGEKEAGMGQVIRIDEGRIRDHLGEMVRGTVEEALNGMLDAEADRLCGAGRYERSEGRQDTRAGSSERGLHTKAGEVKLKVPKLRRQTFETAIIERYRRWEPARSVTCSRQRVAREGTVPCTRARGHANRNLRHGGVAAPARAAATGGSEARCVGGEGRWGLTPPGLEPTGGLRRLRRLPRMWAGVVVSARRRQPRSGVTRPKAAGTCRQRCVRPVTPGISGWRHAEGRAGPRGSKLPWARRATAGRTCGPMLARAGMGTRLPRDRWQRPAGCAGQQCRFVADDGVTSGPRHGLVMTIQGLGRSWRILYACAHGTAARGMRCRNARRRGGGLER